MFRRRRAEAPAQAAEPADPIAALDPTPVPPRLRPLVGGAIGARRRWREVIGGLAPGPLAERLSTLGERIDSGVVDVYATAVRIGEMERVLATLDVEGATAAYKAAKRRSLDGDEPPEMSALEARFESVQRILNASADAEERLRVLEVRIEAAVAQGAEVALTADSATLAMLDADLGGLVDELGALRGALGSLG